MKEKIINIARRYDALCKEPPAATLAEISSQDEKVKQNIRVAWQKYENLFKGTPVYGYRDYKEFKLSCWYKKTAPGRKTLLGAILFAVAGFLFMLYPAIKLNPDFYLFFWARPYIQTNSYWVLPLGIMCFSFAITIWGFYWRIKKQHREVRTKVRKPMLRAY